MGKFNPEQFRVKDVSAGKFDPEQFRVKSGGSADDEAPQKTRGAELADFIPDGKTIDGLVSGFNDGATLGHGANITAATADPLNYTKTRDMIQKNNDSLDNTNVLSRATGKTVGGMVAAAALPFQKIAQGAGYLGRAAGVAADGFATGGLVNTGNVEGEVGGLDLQKRLENANTGALISTAVGQVPEAKNALLSAGKSAGAALKTSAEKLMVKASGATGKQSEKFSKNAGREMIDRGVGQFGDDAEAIATKANSQIKDAESTIDASLKALDEKDVTVSADQIVEKLQGKIANLKKIASQAPIAKKLQGMIDDIIETGNSNIKISEAELTKRGYDKVSRNWQDPEQGQAGKIAYLAYRDAVEDAAKAADPKIAKQFIDAKKTFGLLNPIADAAEKRAATLNQSPLGGLLDVAAAGGAGTMVGGLPGLATGVAAAVGRRVIAPRSASSMSIVADKASKLLTKTPGGLPARVAAPAVKSVVTGINNFRAKDPELMVAKKEESAAKGFEKFANDGADKIIEHDPEFDSLLLERVKKSKKGRDLLIRASDLKPGSKAMDKLFGEIKEEAY